MFSLAATLWSAADWRLTEAQKPSLSPRFQELLVSMTDDVPDARPGLYDVLQVSDPHLRIFGDSLLRSRCMSGSLRNTFTHKRYQTNREKFLRILPNKKAS